MRHAHPIPVYPRLTLAFLLPFLAAGCARYEFDVVQPPDLARHVGEKWDVAHWGPVDYGLRAYDNHLVLDVHNTTDAELRILGDRSYVVGPDGQSHPLAAQTIAPKSFVRLAFPPEPHVYEQSGPRIGLGVGFGLGRAGWGRYRGGYFGGAYDPWFDDEPRYIAVYDGPANAYWPWPGEGDARLTLTFQRGQDPAAIVTHAFVFRKKKM